MIPRKTQTRDDAKSARKWDYFYSCLKGTRRGRATCRAKDVGFSIEKLNGRGMVNRPTCLTEPGATFRDKEGKSYMHERHDDYSYIDNEFSVE